MKRLCFLVVCVCGLSACEPQDTDPGFWLSGELQTEFPADWSFTNDHPEIFIEVSTPYLLPHSVTIWCGEVDGDLYLAAGSPEEKNWPGWVDDEPNVKLQIGESLYPVVLVPMVDETAIAPVRQAFATKYNYRNTGPGGSARYWRVRPRA